MDDIKPRDQAGNNRPVFSRSPNYTPNARYDNHLPSRPQQRQNAATPEPLDSPEDIFEESLRYASDSTDSIDRPPKPVKKSGRSKKPFIILIILLLIAGAGATYWFVIRPKLHPKQQPVVSQQAPETPAAEEKLSGNFQIIATGDMITHDSVNQNAKKADGSYDYGPMLSEVKPLLEKAATRICHDTVPAGGSAISGYPSFSAPSAFISGLATSGCNVMSLASDHIGDQGQAGIDATLQTIDSQKEIVLNAGANRNPEEQAKDRYFNIRDGLVKFAYFSYTTRQNKPSATSFGVNVYSKEKATADIQKVRTAANFVLVSMCWGKEDSADIQAEQDTIAQDLAAAGADIVFGHCTHEVQPVKKITSGDGSRETIVYYSLGNNLNTQLPIETLIGGMAVINIDLASRKITTVGFLPTYMHYEWTAGQKAAKDLNARKNLKLYPLQTAAAPLAASQNGTSVEVQTARLTEITNRFTPVKILKSTEL